MPSVQTDVLIVHGVDLGEEINKKVPLTGARGILAGYESGVSQSTALTITDDSSDNMEITGAVQITVNNGTANRFWVKKVSIKNANATISLGTSWSWIGGSQPTVTNPSLLVLSWDNTQGMAQLNTIED